MLLIREINCQNIWYIPIRFYGKNTRKNCPRTSVFSLSDVVSVGAGSAGSVFSSETPTRVLVLEFIYFHMALGLDLAAFASFVSNCF